MYDRMIEKRGCLRVGSQVLVFGNLFIFLAFYVLKCLSLMSQSNSLFFNLVSLSSPALKNRHDLFSLSNCYHSNRSTQLWSSLEASTLSFAMKRPTGPTPAPRRKSRSILKAAHWCTVGATPQSGSLKRTCATFLPPFATSSGTGTRATSPSCTFKHNSVKGTQMLMRAQLMRIHMWPWGVCSAAQNAIIILSSLWDLCIAMCVIRTQFYRTDIRVSIFRSSAFFGRFFMGQTVIMAVCPQFFTTHGHITTL